MARWEKFLSSVRSVMLLIMRDGEARGLLEELNSDLVDDLWSYVSNDDLVDCSR